MAYVHISKSRGTSLDQYGKVLDELGSDPVTGQLLHIVGESGDTLYIVDVWQSKGHADRFASERLFPAFARAGVRPEGQHDEVELDATVTLGSASKG